MQCYDLRQLYQPLNHQAFSSLEKGLWNAHFWQIAYAIIFSYCGFFKLCCLVLFSSHTYMEKFKTEIHEFSLLPLPHSLTHTTWNVENIKQRNQHSFFYISCYLGLVRNVQRQGENSHSHKLNQTLLVKGSDFKRGTCHLEFQGNSWGVISEERNKA